MAEAWTQAGIEVRPRDEQSYSVPAVMRHGQKRPVVVVAAVVVTASTASTGDVINNGGLVLVLVLVLVREREAELTIIK